jgi:serine/threonine protein kinase/formylglycine-generating enzyme required for sulfatase activity
MTKDSWESSRAGTGAGGDDVEDRLTSILESLIAGDPAPFERASATPGRDSVRLRRAVEKLAMLGLLPTPSGARGGSPRIGGFELLAPLGGGGMGVVHLARSADTGALVAIKLLRPELAHDRLARERLLREAAAMRRLRHPSIVPLHAAGEDCGTHYLALEFVPGSTLAEAIAALAAVPHEALSGRDLGSVVGCENAPRFAQSYARAGLEIALDLASALAHAHAAGVFHRDVKPSNAMLGSDGRARLLDFGLAIVSDVHPLTASFHMIGSLPWTAPERLRGDDSDPALADVYSFGATFYELMTRRRAFHGERDPVRLRQRIFDGEFEAPRRVDPSLPVAVETICLKAMARRPSDRYLQCEALIADLASALASRPLATRRPRRLPPPLRRLARNPAAVAAVAFLVAFLAAWSWRSALSRTTETALAATRARDTASALLVTADDLWPLDPATIARSGGIDDWLATAARIEPVLAVADAELARRVAAKRDEVVARRLRILELERGSLGAGSWESTIVAIREAEEYGGLALAPQLGLVPLGRDPQSRLFEFAVLATGEPPERDGDGRLRLLDGSAAVLVLLPGGSFTMGARRPEAGELASGPHLDPRAEDDESPLTAVVLAPFFVGKHELTQGQWIRLAGANPSAYPPGAVYGASLVTPRHPVESLTHEQAVVGLARHGLSLPTEAQWEYAARAGTTTRFFTGDDPASLALAANLADVTLEREARGGLPIETWLDDGHALYAAVGSFRANRFGLHDVAGNVREHVADAYGPYTNPPRAGDGLREPLGATTFVIRGGGFAHVASLAGSAERASAAADARSPATGVRAARAVTRPGGTAGPDRGL